MPTSPSHQLDALAYNDADIRTTVITIPANQPLTSAILHIAVGPGKEEDDAS